VGRPRRTFGATVLAVREPDGLTVSPSWDLPVPTGRTLSYVARARIEVHELVASR
jgi:voltage-gated potassium channel